ncbi:MAG: serpin family protein [Dysgonamonadaceae bacterium]|jgi:serpin B|nr:serpin family protein [Dysgonamonadaceae bacterium]
MKKLVFLSLVLFGLSACNEISDEKNEYAEPIIISLTENEQKLTEAGQILGFELLSEVMKLDDTGENPVVSPLSLNMALAMVWNGADGETRDSIQKVMGMSDISQDEVNAYFKKLKETLLKTDPTTKLSIANSIWARQGFPFKESFYDLNRQWYDAKVSELDFASPNAPDIINQWCSDNTNGLIKEMIDYIPADAVMYLMNALYFKGSWSDGCGFPASSTKTEKFQTDGGNLIDVQMMSQNSDLLYYSDENLSLACLPYGNGAFRMVFILPAGTVESLLETLKQPDYLSRCLFSACTYDLNLFVPKFKISFDAILNDPLANLGMGIAFSPYADFSGISDSPLCISKVKQNTYIDVNEQGTEAAAVTMIEMKELAANLPKQATLRLDRPFLFMIQETSSNTVLFLGKIGAPEYK